MSVGPATFIVGRARSGTSLLTALLDDHPELLVLPFETHLFDWAAGTDPVRGVLEQTQLWSTLHTHRPDRKRREVEDALRVAFDDTSAVAERLTGLVCAWAKVSGGDPAKRWVEKTPRHLFELSTLVEWYGPETRILILQRDPRDVIASELKQDPSRSVFTQAVSCRVTHEAMRPWLQSPQVHLVVYEDLVADTEGVMREVCGFLGIAADPAAFRPTSMGSEWEGNSRFQSSLRGVSTQPVGRYREVLSPGQVRRVNALLGEQLRAAGYEVAAAGFVRIPERLGLGLAVRSGVWRSRRIRELLRGR